MAVALNTTFPPSYGIQITFDDGVEQLKFGDNRSQTMQLGINHTRLVYSVTWEGLTDTNHATLHNQFRDLGTDYFTWQPEGESTTLKWRPQKGSVKDTKVGWDNWTITAVLEQQFDD